jgi:hypothetical protein
LHHSRYFNRERNKERNKERERNEANEFFFCLLHQQTRVLTSETTTSTDMVTAYQSLLQTKEETDRKLKETEEDLMVVLFSNLFFSRSTNLSDFFHFVEKTRGEQQFDEGNATPFER